MSSDIEGISKETVEATILAFSNRLEKHTSENVDPVVLPECIKAAITALLASGEVVLSEVLEFGRK